MEAYWEWLCSIPQLYRPQIEILIRCFGTPEGVWHASQQELDYLEQKGCAWTAKVRGQQKTCTPEQTVHNNRRQGIQFISLQHPDYPARLRQINEKPFGLFYRGSLPREDQKTVAIVGARMCTRGGRERAERLSEAVVRAGGSVISGGAYGIDGAAQWRALEAGGASFAVLGCGVDVCYPAGHRVLYDRLAFNGGVLSEYAPGTPPRSYHFPLRNRLISALSDVVAVVEARRKSGSLITADYAMEQSRPVLAVPGRPEDELSQGCNELINQGAEMILSVDSFIRSVFSGNEGNNQNLFKELALAPDEKLVYSSLDLQSKSIWELAEHTVLPLAQLSESLLSLEQKGLIRETEHGRYARV